MICPKCGFISDETQKFCQQCGFDLRPLQKEQMLLQSDPVLSAYKQKEEAFSLVCRISGMACIICIAFVYFWLENNLSEIFGTLGLLSFFPAIVTWLISWILCLCFRGKIKNRLRSCMESDDRFSMQ